MLQVVNQVSRLYHDIPFYNNDTKENVIDKIVTKPLQ